MLSEAALLVHSSSKFPDAAHARALCAQRRVRIAGIHDVVLETGQACLPPDLDEHSYSAHTLCDRIAGKPRHALADVTSLVEQEHQRPGTVDAADSKLTKLMPGGAGHPCLQHAEPVRACGCFWRVAHE